MHIGEVAARTELSLRTLRHYDDIGLLRPTGRSEGGFRVYTEDDVEKILLIRRMKPLGFTLEEMSTALQDLEAVRRSAATADGATADGVAGGGVAGGGVAEAAGRLALLQEQATERRGALVRQLEMADEFLDLLGRELGQADQRPG